MINQASRQSFLGENSKQFLHTVPVALIGASGGGSPIGQQLAHIGFGDVLVIDPAIVGEHHRHRQMGVNDEAIRDGWHKVRVLKRLMDTINPRGHVAAYPVKWQEIHELLRSRRLVFTAVDGYETRDDIERYLRSYDVPMIDVGMDVHRFETGHQICGQVIMSQPGSHCLRCFGFINDERLRLEVGNYGATGPRPQVSWPNATLAATAVGMAMAHLLPWHEGLKPEPYQQYDGNTLQIRPSSRLPYLEGTTCVHYKLRSASHDRLRQPNYSAFSNQRAASQK